MSIDHNARAEQVTEELRLPDYVRTPRHDGARRPLTRYRRSLVALDATSMAAAAALSILLRDQVPDLAGPGWLADLALCAAFAAAWLLALFARGAYDRRFLGVGTDEFKRIISGTLLFFAIVAGYSYLVKAELSRGFIFIAIPVGMAFLVTVRLALRQLLYRKRAKGQFSYRTVVLGDDERTTELVARMSKDTYTGYLVVARVLPPDPTRASVEGWLAEVGAIIEREGANAVAITPSTHLNADVVRRLSWLIEGQGIDLLVAPALGDVAGPRITMRPAAGLPLLHLEEAGLSSAQALGKRTLDLIGATIGLVVLSPLLLAVAICIKATSRGPVMFKQWRIGRNGDPFIIWKFRTMRNGADAEREALRAECSHDDPAFKMAADPRITPIGRFLRRWSIDELPQLVNVLTNDMSLVGPRPHPIDDVSRYMNDDFRRLLAKPGMTGLWQVTGRSSLEWTEAVQMDLYYVENWSVAGDIALLGRTARAVIGGHGAS